MKIPSQLQKEEFRFVKIQKGKKYPFEKGWQKDANYSYKEIEKWDGNYGVVCGFGNLTVIDADNEITEKAVKDNLPKTFSVKTGRGGKHFYYICKDIEKPIRLKQEEYGDLGDVQYKGKQVVGPGSLHPNGKRYKVVNNEEIKEVSVTDIKLALSELINDKSEKVKKEEERRKKENNVDFNLSITDVVNTSKLQKRGNEYQGPHPIHGSSNYEKGGPGNFCINPSKNVWHCFRKNCDSGGGPLSWIAVKEGIIRCSEAQPGCLTGKKFKKVLKVAKERYGIEIKRKGVSPDNPEAPYLINGKFSHKLLADEILKKFNVITTRDNEMIYTYHNGVYEEGEAFLKGYIQNKLREKASNQRVGEVLGHVMRSTYKDRGIFSWDRDLINTKNGLIDINNNPVELKEHTPEIHSTTQIPVKYNPEADCPKIRKFVSEIVKEKDVPLIQEMVGYCLYRGYPFARAFMLVGEGANGKTTLIRVIKKLLGSRNVVNKSLQVLSTTRFAISGLYGKLANLCPDLPGTDLRYTGTFKALTGGDPVDAEKKFKSSFSFENYATLIFGANKVPETFDETYAYFRRWILIKFPYKFTFDPNDGHKDRDPHIFKKITTEEEMSGFLNWALEGLKRLLKNGRFSTTETIEETKKEYTIRSSSIAAFCEKMAEKSDGEVITKDEFYRRYINFCDKNNLPKETKVKVGKRVPKYAKYVNPTHARVDGRIQRVWKDLRIKTKEDIEEEKQKKLQEHQKSKEDKVLELYPENQPKSYSEIESEAKKLGVDEIKFNKIHKELKNEGTIFSPRSGKWKKM